MRVLELFCGVNKSVGKVAEAMGWEVISVDINPRANPVLLQDIQEFDEKTNIINIPGMRHIYAPYKYAAAARVRYVNWCRSTALQGGVNGIYTEGATSK